MLRLAVHPLSDPVSRGLERALQLDILARYGGDEPEEPHDADEFTPPAGVFVVAWLEVDGGDAVPVGCGGIRGISADGRVCELKRMYVDPDARGRGVARALLERLEDEADGLGFAEVWLETGTEQPEAMALYESAGYEPIADFGRYRGEPKVRSYGKRISG
ncbi:MAG TPA: GNAT family N-acetyltransferase [Acidimicrobiales bacterium]|nr:GNAT family N-acetyltransferase [Acidimicrobiales bacterium]